MVGRSPSAAAEGPAPHPGKKVKGDSGEARFVGGAVETVGVAGASMATVAGPGSFPPDKFHPGGGGGGGGGGASKIGAKLRRKTPSELRGEQLKRVNVVELVDESAAPLLDSLKKPHLQCSEDSIFSSKVAKNHGVQTQSTLERCNQSRFRTVAEISSSSEKLSGLANIDMDKALKGLAA
ncbi:hypothetical protein NL676_009657 [Syzygium grande]|nr:hypothetical protein NL676_009657 [Syzygium grande]